VGGTSPALLYAASQEPRAPLYARQCQLGSARGCAQSALVPPDAHELVRACTLWLEGDRDRQPWELGCARIIGLLAPQTTIEPSVPEYGDPALADALSKKVCDEAPRSLACATARLRGLGHAPDAGTLEIVERACVEDHAPLACASWTLALTRVPHDEAAKLRHTNRMIARCPSDTPACVAWIHPEFGVRTRQAFGGAQGW